MTLEEVQSQADQKPSAIAKELKLSHKSWSPLFYLSLTHLLSQTSGPSNQSRVLNLPGIVPNLSIFTNSGKKKRKKEEEEEKVRTS